MDFIFLPPTNYSFSQYKYALVNDYYNVCVLKSGIKDSNFYTILKDIEELSHNCIDIKKVSPYPKAIKECDFNKEVYSSKRCIATPLKVCYIISSGI